MKNRSRAASAGGEFTSNFGGRIGTEVEGRRLAWFKEEPQHCRGGDLPVGSLERLTKPRFSALNESAPPLRWTQRFECIGLAEITDEDRVAARFPASQQQSLTIEGPVEVGDLARIEGR